MQAQQNFQGDFWRLLKHPQTKRDSAARLVMDKVGLVFSSKKQHLVVQLLDWITNPQSKKHLKEAAKAINAELLQVFFPRPPRPPRKDLVNLARRLQTVGRDLDRTFGTEAALSSKTGLFLKLAEDCRSRSKDLKYVTMSLAMDPDPPRGRLTYKAFWKHLPIAKLCRELEVPWAIEFSEIETLLRCAYSVRGLSWPYKKRSIEREYSGFRKLKSDDPIKSAAWPKILDRFLLRAMPTK